MPFRKGIRYEDWENIISTNCPQIFKKYNVYNLYNTEIVTYISHYLYVNVGPGEMVHLFRASTTFLEDQLPFTTPMSANSQVSLAPGDLRPSLAFLDTSIHIHKAPHKLTLSINLKKDSNICMSYMLHKHT